KGHAGPCGSPGVGLDIDREAPSAALADTRRLVGFVLERYRTLDDDALLLFFSGRRGYHLGLPLAHNPDPSPFFHRTARRLAEGLAAGAGGKLDTSIYDRVRGFRAPNPPPPRSGLYKRRLTHAEVFGLSPERVVELAREPAPFEIPVIGEPIAEIEADWQEAADATQEQVQARAGRPHPGRLQRATLDFLRDGAE